MCVCIQRERLISEVREEFLSLKSKVKLHYQLEDLKQIKG